MTHTRWFLLAIILLVFATIFAFSQLQKNLNDHKDLDRNTCLAALTNRIIVRDLARAVSEDPATPQTIQDDFATAEGRFDELIKQSHGCHKE